MGKISNAIMMLEYLNTGNKYTAKELSEKVGVSERMIKYYKTEIEESGIRIETFMGPNGGYFLLNNIKPYNTINKYDIQLLEKIKKYVNESEKNKLFELVDKINKIYDISEEKAKFITDIKKCEIEDIKIFENAIKNKERIDIAYKGINGEYTNRTIHPVQIFKYNEEYYITAFCELRTDIRHFEYKNISLNQ